MSCEKEIVRSKMLKMRENGVSLRERKEKSSRIASSLINDLLLPAPAKSIGFYYPVRGEVDTFSTFDFCRSKGIVCLFPRIISSIDMVFLPVKAKRELVKRNFGIYEPDVGVYSGSEGMVPEVLLVPGVAFDRENFRLGYGKGYYDTYLTRYEPKLSIGLGYDFQILDSLRIDRWDKKLDLVLTENGWQGYYENIIAGGSR